MAYSPGERLVTFEIRGIRCGLLICADVSEPELYRAFKKRKVEVLFHSFYNARFNGPIPNDRTVVPANIERAVEYGMWIYANNSSARHSCWPTHIAAPDGSIEKMRRHATGILFHTLTPERLDGIGR